MWRFFKRTMRQFKRSRRVGSQMLRDVRELLEHECSSNLKAMVTFTDVEVTDDLRYATIYYSVLGGEKEKNDTARFLNRIIKDTQFKLGRMLNIKVIPEISFKFDPSIERGMRIEELLNQISKKDDESIESDI